VLDNISMVNKFRYFEVFKAGTMSL